MSGSNSDFFKVKAKQKFMGSDIYEERLCCIEKDIKSLEQELHSDGDILYVSINGEDASATKGNPVAPYKTIAAALTAAAANDTVYVFPGSFTENISIANDDVTLVIAEGAVLNGTITVGAEGVIVISHGLVTTAGNVVTLNDENATIVGNFKSTGGASVDLNSNTGTVIKQAVLLSNAAVAPVISGGAVNVVIMDVFSSSVVVDANVTELVQPITRDAAVKI